MDESTDSGRVETSEILRRIATGDAGAKEELNRRLYPILKRMAAKTMRSAARSPTFSTSDLLQEALVRLIGQHAVPGDRVQFLGVAAESLRRALVDHIRARETLKRGLGWTRQDRLDLAEDSEDRSIDLLDLDEAIDKLAGLNPRHAKVAEMRLFGGMTEAEIATAVGVSVKTIERDWSVAKATIRGMLASGD